MSGVYIKGMEMPTGCDTCPFEVFGDCYGGKAKFIMDIDDEVAMGVRHKKCPLTHVPDHGRLIDAEALWKEEKSADALHKLRPKGESVIYDAGFLAGYRAAAQIAAKMPTIIPADKEETE